jgi:hypothetical protein
VAFITIVAAIIAAVVIIITAVIIIITVMAELCLRAESATLLPVISVPAIKVVGFIIYTSLIFLKELLRDYAVNI